MTELHAILRPMATNVTMHPITWRGQPIDSLATEGNWNGMTFDATYEQLEASLADIPRMYVEPDGSFVWVSSEDPERKLNGQISDDGSHVVFVQIRATCHFEELQPLFQRMGWPTTPLAVQVLPEATMMSVETLAKVMNQS